jgi:mRNA interferase MazF
MNFKKWEIWLASIELVIGSEQGKTRPVIIISENYINQVLPVVNILPITTRKNKRTIYPNEVLLSAGNFGLPNESIVLCYQIRTLDKQRLIKLYGSVSDIELQQYVFEALKFQLGIT